MDTAYEVDDLLDDLSGGTREVVDGGEGGAGMAVGMLLVLGFG